MSEPTPIETVAPVKPGYKTTEFWLTAVAQVVSVLVASGIVPTEGPWAQAVALVTGVLATLGYQAGRAKVKAGY